MICSPDSESITPIRYILAIFYPFGLFCEIVSSLLSLQKQPNAAPNLFQRGVAYYKYASANPCMRPCVHQSMHPCMHPCINASLFHIYSLSLSFYLPLSPPTFLRPLRHRPSPSLSRRSWGKHTWCTRSSSTSSCCSRRSRRPRLASPRALLSSGNCWNLEAIGIFYIFEVLS